MEEGRQNLNEGEMPSSITSSCCNWYPPTGTSKKRVFHLLGLSQECLLVNSERVSTTTGLTQSISVVLSSNNCPF